MRGAMSDMLCISCGMDAHSEGILHGTFGLWFSAHGVPPKVRTVNARSQLKHSSTRTGGTVESKTLPQ